MPTLRAASGSLGWPSIELAGPPEGPQRPGGKRVRSTPSQAVLLLAAALAAPVPSSASGRGPAACGACP